MRKLTFGMNLSLDGYIAAPGDDLGWSVPSDEPWAGDVLVIGNQIILSDAFPQTARLLGDLGFDTVPVAVSEFAKVEGGVTCLSLVFQA